MLEECGLPYRIVPINIRRGDQHEEKLLAISPNGRIPAIVDHSPEYGDAPLALFESGAILQYLAEKSGQFLSNDAAVRYDTLAWVYWQVSGLGPMAGQNGHFLLYAKDKIPYAIERYGLEVRRLYGVLDRQLGRTKAYIAGAYSIADMACFPWVMTHKAQKMSLNDWPHLKRWYTDVRARPRLQAGLAVGKELGWPSKSLASTHKTTNISENPAANQVGD